MKKEKLRVMAIIVLGQNGKDGTCELCGRDGEKLRPYGPNGEYICFDCGMKDKETTNKKIRDFLGGK